MDMSLLARRPRLRSPSTSYPVLPPTVRSDYPALAEDVAVLDEVVTPAFAKYENSETNLAWSDCLRAS